MLLTTTICKIIFHIYSIGIAKARVTWGTESHGIYPSALIVLQSLPDCRDRPLYG